MIRDAAVRVLIAQADAHKRDVLPIWTVYDRPRDHPDGYIARLHEVAKGTSSPTGHTLAGDLAQIRKTFVRAGLTVLPRDPDDEPHIVESWL